ncbi:hypothetical protein L6164_004748 [Bauhinia variegata]|uniref:Uncharacterized protein n=1 Tax=Bauhinia variegata TaxID=167791 RepID=A0ACB9PNH9_BAUVA|nr:hypothetical protein L6164_004748 [Bauhinia variegata]
MAIVSFMPLIFLCFLVNLVTHAAAERQYQNCVTERGNFTANATYMANLDALLDNLTANTQIDYGFYNLSYGQNPEKVSVIGLCRGDLNPDVCRSCLNNSRVFLPQFCPNYKEAIAFYENCMLRYSNRSIFGVVEDTPWYYYWWPGNNVTNVDQYNQVLFKLLPELQSKAASGDNRLKYAAGSATVTDSLRIYALVQCTPDLSEQLCIDCLGVAFSEISSCCNSVAGVTIGRPSCNVRYGTNPFYEAIPDTPKGNSKLRTVIAIVASVVAFIIVIVLVFIYLRVKMARKYIEVWRKWNEGTALDIVDSTLSGASTNEIMRCIHIGLLCVQKDVANRPTMASVMLMLNSNSATLPKPSEPAFVLQGRTFTGTQLLERNSGLVETAINNVQASVNEASNTELYPR